MRGTIIMWRDDHGVVAAAGHRFEFDISHWNGNVAPAPNMTVDVATSDGELSGITPVSETELAQETLAEMTGAGSRRAKAVFDDVGKDVAIGYGVFLLLALFARVFSADGVVDAKVTLADLLSGDLASAAVGGGSGRGVTLVLLATATIAVPHLWKHRLAPLAFAVPLILTLMAFWPVYEMHRRQQQAMQAMGELGPALGQVAEQMAAGASPVAGLGLGAWLLVATAIFLAVRGVLRLFGRR